MQQQPLWKRCLRDPRTSAGVFPLLLLCAAAFFLWRNWGRFGDIQIDFGRELYIAWRLSQGEALYRDLAYFNGPLSPYINGLAMFLAGANLTTLLACNIAVLGVASVLLWRLIRRVASPACASVALYFFLATSAFNAALEIDNYNWLTPYSHELTHGLLLLFIGLTLVLRFAQRPSPGRGFWCGLVVGMGLLTKPETALGIAAGVGVGLFLALARAPEVREKAGKALAATGLGALLPPVVALAALSLAMPASEALAGMCAMWKMAANASISQLPFYQRVTGMDAPVQNALAAGVAVLLHLGLAAYCASLGLLASRMRPPWLRALFPPAFLCATYALLSPAQKTSLFLALPRAWPFLLPVFLISLCVRALGRKTPYDAALVATAALCAAASALTLKIFLNPNLLHYGALLLVPAALVFIVAAARHFPGLFPNAAAGHGAAAAAMAFCLVLPWPLLRFSDAHLRQQNVPVAGPLGTMQAGQRGPVMAQTLAFLRREAKAGDTVAVLPEGAMLNFLGGYANATPYSTLMPPEWLQYGQDHILATFRAHPPTWIILLHRVTTEYGYGFFGKGYARELAQFLAEHYEERAVIGARPMTDDRFGACVYRFAARAPGATRAADAPHAQ
jgi:hypothetical protein